MRRADLHDAIRHLAKALIDLEDVQTMVRLQAPTDTPDARDWRPGDVEALTVARALVVGALGTLKDVRGALNDLGAVRDATVATWRREVDARTAEPTLRQHWGDRFDEVHEYGSDGRLRQRREAVDYRAG